MSVWELLAYGTDSRYADDVRYRVYTTSQRKAQLFNQVPRIQWIDSGHGIVFMARPHRGRRQREVRAVASYVDEHMKRLSEEARSG